MSVTVETAAEPKIYTLDDMEVGVLYKSADGEYDTIYTKSLQGSIVWFENKNRIGVGSSIDRYVAAPAGSKVVLSS